MASDLLRHLLTTDSRYLTQWQKRARRKGAYINQSAVANVLDDYLFESGEGCSGKGTRSLKDRVSRALSGTSLSWETLGWFINAFSMSDIDANRLREAHGGSAHGPSGISHTLRGRRELARPQRHRTMNLIERYEVGPTGTLASRHTSQVIRAAEDGVTAYFFNHEPEAASIEVLHGGRLGRRYEYGGGLLGVEIMLCDPLDRSDVALLEYRTAFSPTSSRAMEVRRPAFARAENVSLSVRFTGERRPRKAWTCVWDDPLGEQPVEEESVGPGGDSLYRFLPYIEETVVGFRWQ
ncbi:hypothetical protein RI138_04835 [Streptomyces sp. C11-1]|uniref:Uncharacterized protein n=1 Tax=Streptomyces durocortorensis TaxID=2811104 RepID=A0ABY9VWQ3_9ACTN|nr:hypothetical protein [Streptomyces durocortorensis]WNF26192.1 hypothetical protein RI138_04835 [Streptomyces durocortorensis]